MKKIFIYHQESKNLEYCVMCSEYVIFINDTCIECGYRK